jgi:hypothetical protein
MKTRLPRRDILRSIGLTLLSGGVTLPARALDQRRRRKPRRAARKPAPAPPPLSGSNLYKDVIAYYNLGEHRTATEPDLKTSDWLAAELRAAGLPVMFQPFSLRQFFVRRSYLTLGDKRVRCFPLWPPRATGAEPVHAPLAAYQKGARAEPLKSRIAVVRLPFDPRAAVYKGSGHAEMIEAAAKAGAAAVIAVTEGPTGEIIALNSFDGAAPWPLPVVLAGGRDEPALRDALESNAQATLLVEGTEDAGAKAKNVIGRVARGDKLIVVSTPQSGWFRCAGERGPGIALFLGLARWARQRSSPVGYLFVSTSGHELGSIGMKHFMKELAPRTDRVLCWLHLGAGIATFDWEEAPAGLRKLRRADPRRYLMCSSDLEPLLAKSFAGQAGLSPVTGKAVGEMDLVLERRYRAFAIAAGHRFHHTPADSPEMTAPELLDPVARALVASLEAIERLGAG